MLSIFIEVIAKVIVIVIDYIIWDSLQLVIVIVIITKFFVVIGNHNDYNLKVIITSLMHIHLYLFISHMYQSIFHYTIPCVTVNVSSLPTVTPIPIVAISTGLSLGLGYGYYIEDTVPGVILAYVIYTSTFTNRY